MELGISKLEYPKPPTELGRLKICLVVWNMNGLFFHNIWNNIIPSDFHSIIFQRGRWLNHQPDMVLNTHNSGKSPAFSSWVNPRHFDWVMASNL